MTPTLYGRWQTRLFLLGTVGLVVTFIFGSLNDDKFMTPLVILGYVLVIGFLWDIFYNFLQTFRWDRDWPPAFQLGAGILEGIFIWALINSTFIWDLTGLEGLPGVSRDLTLGLFITHYASVWVTTFAASQGPMRIFFPRWRFRGGQWL